MEIPSLPKPTRCILWRSPERIHDKFPMEELETYEDDSHSNRCLLKCKECGQLYFYEWFEWVDWDHGRDRQYVTYLPVETREQIDTLKAMTPYALAVCTPRLLAELGRAEWIRD